MYFGGFTPRFIRIAECTESASDPRFYFGYSSYRSTPRHCSLTVLSGSRKKAVRYVRWWSRSLDRCYANPSTVYFSLITEMYYRGRIFRDSQL